MNITVTHNIRTAAKSHVCNDCEGFITRGDHYSDARITDGVTMWTWRSHRLCGALVQAMYYESAWTLASEDVSLEAVRNDLRKWWIQFVEVWALNNACLNIPQITANDKDVIWSKALDEFHKVTKASQLSPLLHHNR
jgi:hypothetical protein